MAKRTGVEQPAEHAPGHGLVAMCRTRTLPWFALAALLAIVAAIAYRGTGQAMIGAAAFAVFLTAAIRAVGLAVRDDPVRSSIVARSRAAEGGYVGWMAAESARARRRRAAARRSREGSEHHDS